MANSPATLYNRVVESSTLSPARPAPWGRILRDPLGLGTCCGLASAVGYTAANACLRAVAACDPVWVSSVKAFPTVALFGPLVLWRLCQGSEPVPPRQPMLVLILTALVCQLFGNVVFQWSLGMVGMALTVPLTLGTMIFGAAVLGRFFLHESVTVTMACSLILLVASIFALSLGAGEASASLSGNEGIAAASSLSAAAPVNASAGRGESPASLGRTLAGVAGACCSGLAYALLGVAIRAVVTDKISVLMTMVTVTLVGVVVLGAMSLGTLGWSQLLATRRVDFAFMMLAGFFNAVAFLALTKSLQLVPIAYVNALNASQAALGALTGVVLFSEPSSWWLWLGVALTAIGLLLMRRPKRLSTTPARGRDSEKPCQVGKPTPGPRKNV